MSQYLPWCKQQLNQITNLQTSLDKAIRGLQRCVGVQEEHPAIFLPDNDIKHEYNITDKKDMMIITEECSNINANITLSSPKDHDFVEYESKITIQKEEIIPEENVTIHKSPNNFSIDKDDIVENDSRITIEKEDNIPEENFTISNNATLSDRNDIVQSESITTDEKDEICNDEDLFNQNNPLFARDDMRGFEADANVDEDILDDFDEEEDDFNDENTHAKKRRKVEDQEISLSKKVDISHDKHSDKKCYNLPSIRTS